MLRRLLLSLQRSTVVPESIHIIDNGRDYRRLSAAIAYTVKGVEWDVRTPQEPMGIAASWNWFLASVPEERIISNDDVMFAPQSISKMVETKGDLVEGVGFSCFLIRDTCVERVGQFDETISPGYAYFEDSDYRERMLEMKVNRVEVNAKIVHGDGRDGSSTWRAGTPEEIAEHWRRYNLAQRNFIKKYGAPPAVLEARREARKVMA
jgi:hypothetical protein